MKSPANVGENSASNAIMSITCQPLVKMSTSGLQRKMTKKILSCGSRPILRNVQNVRPVSRRTKDARAWHALNANISFAGFV